MLQGSIAGHRWLSSEWWGWTGHKLLQHGQHLGPLNAARELDYHLLNCSEISLRWAKWRVCLLTISVNGHVIRKVRCCGTS